MKIKRNTHNRERYDVDIRTETSLQTHTRRHQTITHSIQWNNIRKLKRRSECFNTLNAYQ